MRKKLVMRLLPLVVVLTLLPVSQASAFERLGQYGVGVPTFDSGGIMMASSVAVAPDGTVVVGDAGAQRVELFSQSGKFLRAFGKDVSIGGGSGAEVCVTDCKAGSSGTASGEFKSPWGVAAGPGEIFVSELSNNRVSVFDYQGHFLRAFGANVGGAGVNVCTSTCGAGTAGPGGGQMAGPAGIALDASGHLYISELGLARVDVFDAQSGQFQRAFGKDVGGAGVDTCTTACMAGTSGSSPGEISLGYGLALAPNGDVFVSEQTNSRVSVFNGQGQFQRTFGSVGAGAGQLTTPYEVAVTPDGANVYVADSGNNRLDAFAAGGAFSFALGLDVIPGAPVAPEVCTTATTCKVGVSAYGIGEFSAPEAAGTDCRGAVYVGNLGRIDKYGEPGARIPPCPSNAFSFGALRKNRRRGTASLRVTVPGPGTLTLRAGRKLKATARQPSAAGTLSITIKATGKGVKALNRKGKLRGTLRVTFTPPNGDPNTRSRSIALSKKLKKKHKRRHS